MAGEKGDAEVLGDMGIAALKGVQRFCDRNDAKAFGCAHVREVGLRGKPHSTACPADRGEQEG